MINITLNEFVLIVGMAVVTFVTRYPVMVYFGRLEIPEPIMRTLRFVPPAVLTAITVPMVVMPDGEQIALTYTNPALFGSAAAALVAWRTHNLPLTIGAGMALFWGWRLIVG
jgi:branched-subunit amino acid transport protein